MDIWGAINYEKKGLVYFLAAKNRMILEIYVDHIFQPLAILFYNECLSKLEK